VLSLKLKENKMPEETFERPQIIEPETPTRGRSSSGRNWPKAILAAIFGFALLCAAAYAGYWYGTENAKLKSQSAKPQPKTQIQTAPTPIPTSKPTPTSENSQQFKTHDSTLISFQYPASWYAWSYGRGVSLEYFQINSVTQADEQNPNRAVIFFDIQVPGYTEGHTFEEQRERVRGFQQQYPDQNYVISERKIDGQNALVYEDTIANSPSYAKTVWVRKNNVKYIITMSVCGETTKARDALTDAYEQDFEAILSSITLKYVDPAEVERMGNHPD